MHLLPTPRAKCKQGVFIIIIIVSMESKCRLEQLRSQTVYLLKRMFMQVISVTNFFNIENCYKSLNSCFLSKTSGITRRLYIILLQKWREFLIYIKPLRKVLNASGNPRLSPGRVIFRHYLWDRPNFTTLSKFRWKTLKILLSM